MARSGSWHLGFGFQFGRICIMVGLLVACIGGLSSSLKAGLLSTPWWPQAAAGAGPGTTDITELGSTSITVSVPKNTTKTTYGLDTGSNRDEPSPPTVDVSRAWGRPIAVSVLGSEAKRTDGTDVVFNHEVLSPPIDTGTVEAYQNETDKDLQLLRSVLIKPSIRPYKFYGYNVGGGRGYAGQSGQDHWVDNFLGQRSALFVVESGAYDGEEGSNSLFFEIRRKSQCLLIEANPVLQKAIKGKHRKCHFLKGGLSTTGRVGSFKFKLAGGLGGLVEFLGKDSALSDRVKSHLDGKRGSPRSGAEVDVPCFPLVSVLEEIGQNVVDYWSLDTEGSEPEILRHTDFSKIEVGFISVEHNKRKHIRMDIKSILWRSGFWRVAEIDQDDMYANPCYFVKRRLHFPFPGPGSKFPPPSTWEGPRHLVINQQDLTDLQGNLERPSVLLGQKGDPETQLEEHAWVDKTMGKRTGLLLIECGLHKEFSFSTWFATMRKWTCLVTTGLRLSNAALQVSSKHCYRLRGDLSSSMKVEAHVYPLHLILRGMDRHVVDHMSLGAGIDIMSIVTRGIDFGQTEVGLMSVTLADAGVRNKVKKAMESNGFRQVKSLKSMDFYANPCYFMKHNLTFPSASPL